MRLEDGIGAALDAQSGRNRTNERRLAREQGRVVAQHVESPRGEPCRERALAMSRVAGEKQRSAVPAKRAGMDHAKPAAPGGGELREAGPDRHRGVLDRQGRADHFFISDDGYAVVLLGDNNISDFRQLGPAHHGSVLQERVDLLEQADAVVVHPKGAIEKPVGPGHAGPHPARPAGLGCGHHRGSFRIRRLAVLAQRFVLPKDIGYVGDRRVGWHRELLVQGSADLSRRLAVLEQTPDEGSGRVQRIEPPILRVEKQAFLANVVQAQVGKCAKLVMRKSERKTFAINSTPLPRAAPVLRDRQSDLPC